MPFPAVLFLGCVESLIVVVEGERLRLRLLGRVLTDGFHGIIIDEFSRPQFVADGTVYSPLLAERIHIPNPRQFCFVILRYAAVRTNQLPKKIKRSHKKFFLLLRLYYAVTEKNLFFVSFLFASFFFYCLSFFLLNAYAISAMVRPSLMESEFGCATASFSAVRLMSARISLSCSLMRFWSSNCCT